MLLVAAVAGYAWRRFAAAAVLSTLLWATAYAAIGVAGATILPDTRTAVVVTVVAALLFTAAQAAYRRWRPRPSSDPG